MSEESNVKCAHDDICRMYATARMLPSESWWQCIDCGEGFVLQETLAQAQADVEALLKAVDGHFDDLKVQYIYGVINTIYASFEDFLLDQYPELAALPERLKKKTGP
jgi:hypothetical protein